MSFNSSTSADRLENAITGRLFRPLNSLVRFGRRSPLGAVAAILILALVLMSIIGPFVAPYDPESIGVAKKYAWPSSEHLLGADILGRDVLSRVLNGAWVSMLVG